MLVDYLRVFITGGVICALVQLLMEKTKMMPGRIMVLLVCSGAILGMLGIYKPIVDFGQAGATVPLLGFGYNLWKGGERSCRQSGIFRAFYGWLYGFGSRNQWITGVCIFGIPGVQFQNQEIRA